MSILCIALHTTYYLIVIYVNPISSNTCTAPIHDFFTPPFFFNENPVPCRVHDVLFFVTVIKL